MTINRILKEKIMKILINNMLKKKFKKKLKKKKIIKKMNKKVQIHFLYLFKKQPIVPLQLYYLQIQIINPKNEVKF
jgi:hypothetical protein